MGYKKFKLSKKIIAATLSGCFVLGMIPDKSIFAESTTTNSNWAEVESIASKYYGEWVNTDYNGAITNRTPHTALMGNGDMGVTSYGNNNEKTYLISKGDFWSAGDLKTQQPFGLSDRRTQIISLGGITIKSNNNEVIENKSLTIGEKVTAEASGYHDSFYPQLAINGEIEDSNSEGWVSPPGANHWIKIDLGEEKMISKYLIYHHATARPDKIDMNTSDFEVLVSNDNENWTVVDSVVGNTKSVTEVVLDNAISARYVKVNIIKASNEGLNENSRARMVEIELFENPEDESIHGKNSNLGAENYERQEIVNATLKTEMNINDASLTFNTWTSATENAMITEIKSNESEYLDLSVEAWTKDDSRVKFPTDAGIEGDVAWATRSTNNEAADNTESWLSKAAISTKIVGDKEVEVKTDNNSKSTINFGIEPNETVYLVTTIGGGGQTYDYKGDLKNDYEPIEESLKVLEKVDTIDEINELYTYHTKWWKDYWMKSYIDIEDKEIEEYYYGSLYYMGCTAREDKMAPGLYGIWRTTDEASWSGDFHLNYNFEAPFYGMYSSNRYESAYSILQPILDFMPEAEKRSKDSLALLGDRAIKYMSGRPELKDGIAGGVIYPVGLGPWGSVTDKVYLDQTLNAPFAATSFISYYNYTQDEKFLVETAYPFLNKVATFYLSWCEKEYKEDGTYQYNLYDGPHEGTFEKNAGVTIGLVKNVLNTLIQTADIHKADSKKVEAWKDLYDNMADIPIRKFNEVDVYALSETGDALRTNEQSVNLEFIHPGDQLGFNSSPEELNLARETIRVRQEANPDILGNINNTGKEYLHGIISGYDPGYLVDKFKQFNISKMQENFTIDDGYHGIEKSGAIEMINRMMMQSHEGIIKVFPNWLEEDDAKFVDLREKGAFLVSSEYDGNLKEVKYVDIFSEKGKDVSIVSPWGEGAVIIDEEGNIVDVTKGTTSYTEEVTYSFKTEAGKKYNILKNTLNKHELEKLINLAKELNKDHYDNSSWKELEKVLEKSEKILNNNETTQEEIDSVIQELNNSIKNLVENIDKVKNFEVKEKNSNSVKLSWSEAEKGTPADKYLIYIDGTKIAEVKASDVLEYEAINLKSNTIYGFKIAIQSKSGKVGKAKSINVRTSK